MKTISNIKVDFDDLSIQADELGRNLLERAKSEKLDAILMFSDISDSTRLSEEDEEQYFLACFQHFLRAHKMLNKHISIVKTIGDEVMFSLVIEPTDDVSVLLASLIEMAFEFQNVLRRVGIETKIGLHLCEKVLPWTILEWIKKQKAEEKEEDKESNNANALPIHPGDMFGAEVNHAARIMSVAKKGQLLISEEILKKLPKKPTNKISYDYPMVYTFKGFEKRKKPSKVIQLIHEDIKTTPLSEIGYDFRTLTIIDIKDTSRIEEVHKKMQTFFIDRYVLCHMRKAFAVEGMGDGSYALVYLLQSPSYRNYTHLLKKFKEDELLSGLVGATYTVPLWNNPNEASKLFNLKKEIEASCMLWSTKSYQDSEIIKSSFAKYLTNKHIIINEQLMGTYDNFAAIRVFNHSYKKAQSRLEEFEKKHKNKMRTDGRILHVRVLPNIEQ